jgi:hypothetical protein
MTKYSIPDDYEWADEKEQEQGRDKPRVYTDHHVLVMNDEREEIDRYNGLQWYFLIDDGTITGVDVSHYCPGPGHTDPMGFVGWSDVPDRVQRAVLRELNAREVSDVVDIEATEEVAEVAP